MNMLSQILDAYNFRARLIPMILVMLPFGLAGISWFPAEAKLYAAMAGVGGTLGLGVLFAEMARDLGKHKENQLFKNWGGKPSTQLMSFRSSSLNPLTLKRYRAILQKMRPDLRLPISAEAEAQDPLSADSAYESCGDYLRRETRDKSKFPLVFEANVSYGFRRNLWAMKPAATCIGALSAAACVLRLYVEAQNSGTVSPIPAISGAAVILLLVWWIVRISPAWVKIAAFAYAEQLLEACQSLEGSEPPSSRTSIIL